MKKVLMLIALVCSFSFADALDDYLNNIRQEYAEAKDKADIAKQEADRLSSKEGQEELQRELLERRKEVKKVVDKDLENEIKTDAMKKIKEDMLNKNKDIFVEENEINSFTDVEVKADEADIEINYNERREYVN